MNSGKRQYSGSLAALAVAALVAGCGGSNNSADAGPQGGPVLTGMNDNHCEGDGGITIQPTSMAACHPADAGMDLDAGAPGPTGMSVYGPTRDGTASYDDDCKYYVSFTNTPVYRNHQVYFTVTATDLATGAPLTGAQAVAEVFLSDTHPAPNSNQMTTENPPGTYTIGPILFDASGQWTVRFHFFEQCSDQLDDSPHGHAAFYINVP